MAEIKNIKSFPYKVPDGYFDKLQNRLSAIPRESLLQSESKPLQDDTSTGKEMALSFWNKFKPYLALAACFAIAVTIGSFILTKTTDKTTAPQGPYENILYADMIPVTNPYMIYGDSGTTANNNEITDDDIENYLITSGTTVEHIEYVTYENKH
jgi:hypothetical protein